MVWSMAHGVHVGCTQISGKGLGLCIVYGMVHEVDGAWYGMQPYKWSGFGFMHVVCDGARGGWEM